MTLSIEFNPEKSDSHKKGKYNIYVNLHYEMY